MDKKALLDLFHSNGNSFQKTADVLSSHEADPPKTVMTPEFLYDYEQKLIAQAKLESLKVLFVFLISHSGRFLDRVAFFSHVVLRVVCVCLLAFSLALSTSIEVLGPDLMVDRAGLEF